MLFQLLPSLAHADTLGTGESMKPTKTSTPAPYVLVVEDDSDTNKLITIQLRRSGYETQSVDDGTSAIEALAARRPDLMCVDLGLPLLSGFELCQHVRAQSHLKGLPVLVMTSRTSLEDVAHARESGADEILFKPFRRKQFLATVARLVATSKSLSFERANEDLEIKRTS